MRSSVFVEKTVRILARNCGTWDGSAKEAFDSTPSALLSLLGCDPSVAVPCLPTRNANAGLSDETALRYGGGQPWTAETRLRFGFTVKMESMFKIFRGGLLTAHPKRRRAAAVYARKVVSYLRYFCFLLGISSRRLIPSLQ